MTDPNKLSRIFKILSADTRVRIIQLLKDHPLCVGALAARLNISPGAVSQHLRILRAADLVEPERQGYYIHYGLNEETFDRWKNALEQFFGTQTEQQSSLAYNNYEKNGDD